jgi:predicted nuclease of restriction endonuclease-like (RecB) superfamily
MNEPQTNKIQTLHFENLVNNIEQIHHHFQQQAVKAVNVSLTIRNWLIGFYIVEFEQDGADRAKYGEKLFSELAIRFKTIKGIDRRSLYRFRDFYRLYLHLSELIFSQINDNQILKNISIVGLATPQSVNERKVGLMTTQLENKIQVPAEKILHNLSYTHIEQLLQIEDSVKRAFYEIACIKGTWSVQELKRQINSLAYERVGLSSNTEIAFEQLHNKIEPEQISDAVKSVFFFDFLGLQGHDLVEEQELETALINHLQAFIQELGIGFCFEARQKRILIDDEYYFTDLVFYHRILKCHILIELKIDSFKHEHLSQLNTYVAYFNAEIRRFDDNPAIKILLCTENGKKLVEYATAGMDNQLFVSKYLLELPKKEQLEEFIEKEVKKWEKR